MSGIFEIPVNFLCTASCNDTNSQPCRYEKQQSKTIFKNIQFFDRHQTLRSTRRQGNRPDRRTKVR